MARCLQCFFVLRIHSRTRARQLVLRKHIIEGQRATVHAYSKTQARQLLEDAGYSRKQYRVSGVPNTSCIPETLPSGWHCTHCLIAKHSDDPTPLGSVLPNSPEWHDRYRNPKPGLSSLRHAQITSVRRRKDIGDG